MESRTPHVYARHIMDVEARIVKVCNDNGLSGNILDGFCTPQVAVWRLALAGYSRKDVNTITRLGNALSLALRTQVRVGNVDGLLSIEVPLPIDLRCLLQVCFLPPPHGLRIPIGMDMMTRPYFVNFEQHPHLLLLGATKQAGKTETLRTIIYQLASGNSPEEVQFVLIDLKNGQGLDVFEGVAHTLMPVARTVEEAMHAIRWLIAEMRRRYAEKTFMPHIFLCIDEALLLSKGWAGTDNALGELTAVARGASIHVLLCIQRATKETLRTSMVGANVLDRICGLVENSTASYHALAKEQAGAHTLLGNGDVLAFVGKRLSRVQIGYTHPSLIEDLPTGGGNTPIPIGDSPRKRGRGGHNRRAPTEEMIAYFGRPGASLSRAKRKFGIGSRRAKRAALIHAARRGNGSEPDEGEEEDVD